MDDSNTKCMLVRYKGMVEWKGSVRFICLLLMRTYTLIKPDWKTFCDDDDDERDDDDDDDHDDDDVDDDDGRHDDDEYDDDDDDDDD